MPAKPRLKQLAQDGATDGQHILWNNANGVWEPGTPPAEGVPTQEAIATEVITNTDTAMAATLTSVPTSALSVKITLNGVLQRQGATFDYTVVPATGVITWLALTGSAVDMDTTDEMVVFYET